MAITRLGSGGYGVKQAGPFAGKTPSGDGHPVGVITRPGPGGYGVRRTGSFAGKTSSGGGSTHPVGVITRLGSGGYGARRNGSFADKTPDVPIIIPPDIGPIGGGSGGGGGYRLPTYVTPGSKPSRFNIPIIDHNEDDEEQIVIALLMQVAKTEFFQ